MQGEKSRVAQLEQTLPALDRERGVTDVVDLGHDVPTVGVVDDADGIGETEWGLADGRTGVEVVTAGKRGLAQNLVVNRGLAKRLDDDVLGDVEIEP